MPRASISVPFGLLVVLGVAIACGPSVATDGGGSTGVGETSTSSPADDGPNTTAPGTTANTTSPTSVTATTVATTTDEGPLDDGGCFTVRCPDPDGGSSVECDVWAQDCPEGEKCMPWANDGGPRWSATRCSPVAARPNLPGEPCTVEGSPYSGLDSCDIGAMCWDVDPLTNEGVCVANCTGSEANPACADDLGTECMIAYEGVIHLCLEPCDPLVQDCIATSSCLAPHDVFFCAPDASGRAGALGSGCDSFDACDPGLFCANPELVAGCVDVGCCAEFCELGGAPCTTEGTTCVAWYDDGTAPPGYESVGACVLAS